MVSLGGKKNSEEARILYYPQNEILLLFFCKFIIKKFAHMQKMFIFV